MAVQDEDLYEVLQVSRKAEQEVIDAAYRRLARKYHPDANPGGVDDARMKRINAAYEVLRDPESRAEYDRKRRRARTVRKRAREERKTRKSGATASPDRARPASQQRRESVRPKSEAVRTAATKHTAAPGAWRGCLGMVGSLISIVIAMVVSAAIRNGCNSSRPREAYRPAPSTYVPPAPPTRTLTIAHEIVWPNGLTGVCSDVSIRGAIDSAAESRLRSHFYVQNRAWLLGGRDATTRSIASCSLVPRDVRGLCTRRAGAPMGMPGVESGTERLLVYSPALARGGQRWCPDEGGVWSPR